MFSFLLRQFFNGIGVLFRTVWAAVTRAFSRAASGVRRLANLPGEAARVADVSVQTVAEAVKKPSRREDYIETPRLFISKSFLFLLLAGLVAAGLLCYFVVWPFLLSHFLTARFYQEDRRVPEWTGKAVVYYDKDKRVPMYSGSLVEGVLQGEGSQYDQEGLLTYEGGFLDGKRSGNGTAYDAGVKVYQGQFLNDVYEGRGSLYEDGAMVYEGQFLNGLFEGKGSLYKDGSLTYHGTFAEGQPDGMGVSYDGGVRVYEGAFSKGLYDGAGEEYYPDGTLKYKGVFSKGFYEGEGAFYDETGRLRYKGSFSAGLYDGGGTVFLENGDQIRSEFSAGVGGGVIQWYRDGRLWYSGGADDLTANGFGTLYASSGKTVYAGEMDHGSLDGGWLLGRTAGELREIFGDASVTETGRKGAGFLIINRDLNLTVLCTFQQGEEEARAYRIWFEPAQGTDAAALLPWKDRAEAEVWAGSNRDPAPEHVRVKGTAYLPDGGVGGDWYQSVFFYQDHNRSLVSWEEESAPFRLIWAQPGGLDVIAPKAVEETVAQAQTRLDGLLKTLEGVGGTGNAGAGTGCGNASQADVARLLRLTRTARDAYDLVNALTDYYVWGQAVKALEASQPLLQQALIGRQRLLKQGQTNQDAVDSAQDRLDALDRQLVQYRTSQEQARLEAQRLTGLRLEGYDLAGVLAAFDPAALNVASLYDAAFAYARGTAAGRYEVDAGALEVRVKTLALDLNSAYENIRAGRKSLERCSSNLETAVRDYGRGTLDREALYDAQCAVNDAAAAFIQTVGAYTKLVNQLNDLSGGALAEDRGWLAEPFAVIFESEIRRAEAAAEEEKQRPAEAAPGGETADAGERASGG